jgi:hypothetical protein
MKTQRSSTLAGEIIILGVICTLICFLDKLSRILLWTIRILAGVALLFVIGSIIAQLSGYFGGLPEKDWREIMNNIYGNEVVGWVVIILAAYGVVLLIRGVKWRTEQDILHRYRDY